MAASRSSRRRSPAARSWSARPVSTTSLLVRPEVQVAARRADRLGDLADERDDVVVGGPLDLGDPPDVDPARASIAARASVGDEAAGRLDAGDRQLDPQHGLEAGLRRSRSRPSRAGCSAGSCRGPARAARRAERTRPAAAPRCRAGAARPSKVIAVGEQLGLGARGARSAPRPTTVEDPTAARAGASVGASRRARRKTSRPAALVAVQARVRRSGRRDRGRSG